MQPLLRPVDVAVSLAIATLGFSTFACTGVIGGAGGSADSAAPAIGAGSPASAGGAGAILGGAAGTGGAGAPGASATPLSARTRFLRLTHQEWENAARDTLRLPAAPDLSKNFASDTPDGNFDTNQRRRIVTPPLVDDYRTAAEKLADQVVSSSVERDAIGASSSALSSDAGLTEWLEAWLLRAYRRPATSEDLTRYKALYAQGPLLYPDETADAAGVRLVLTATLQSPNFLYLVEQAAAGTPLSDFELASRLSFALTSAPPSDDLLKLAADKRLHEAAQLESTAAALLASPSGGSVLQSFHRQLLRMQQYASIQGDPKNAAQTKLIAPQLLRDGLAFVNHSIVETDGGLRALLTDSQLFAGAATAPLYGADHVTGDTPVALDVRPERRGFLTTAVFLAAYSLGLTPDAIHRGVFINLQILCKDLPAPPKNATPVPAGLPGTNRQQIESHTGKGTCGAPCHGVFLNPPGYAFENYDGLGRYRTTEAAGPIDASGSMDLGDGPVEFKDGVDFSALLAESPLAHACYARRWSEYLLSRDVKDAQPSLIADLTSASREKNASARALIEAIVQSPAFTEREVEVQP